MGNKEFSGAQPATIDAQTTVARKRAELLIVMPPQTKSRGNHFHVPSRLFRVQLDKLRSYFFGLDSGGTIPLIR